MAPDRRQQIKTTLEAALERRRRDRATYLDGVRATDPELAGEVEELLAHDLADSFLEHPAVPPGYSGLASGTRLGQYVIEAELGAGGMGEVYQATDTRLDRTVAIKVLPAELAGDPKRRERFAREAKTVAALNHPHICTLYDVGRATPSPQPSPQRGDGARSAGEGAIDFLVLEYLEGESLQDRLTRGALPLDQALTIAIQIASALDKAHSQGITHRDLKPGNIFLTKAGAKLLDFGLAKLTEVRSAKASTGRSTKSADSLTAEGTFLGTFQYMAPEQLDGREADARTDIWAFGCLLYEMVTGQKAFEGASQASLAGAIMSVTPAPVSSCQPMSPPVLDHVVATCLARDPDQRWQGAGDVARQLRWVMEGGSRPGLPARVHPSGSSQNRGRGLVAAAMLGAVVTGVASWGLTGPSPRQVVRYSIHVPSTQRGMSH